MSDIRHLDEQLRAMLDNARAEMDTLSNGIDLFEEHTKLQHHFWHVVAQNHKMRGAVETWVLQTMPHLLEQRRPPPLPLDSILPPRLPPQPPEPRHDMDERTSELARQLQAMRQNRAA
jgi:hypothetical protein